MRRSGRPTGPEVKPARLQGTAFHGSSAPTTARPSPGLGKPYAAVPWWVKLGIVPERIEPGHPEPKNLDEETASARAQPDLAFDRFRPATTTKGRTRRVCCTRVQAHPARISSPEYVAAVTVRVRSWRDQVEGGPVIRECVPQRRARSSCNRTSEVHTVRTTPDRYPRGSTRHP